MKLRISLLNFIFFVSFFLGYDCKFTLLVGDSLQFNCQFMDQAYYPYLNAQQLSITRGDKSFAIYGWWQFVLDSQENKVILSISINFSSNDINDQLLVLKLSKSQKFQLTLLKDQVLESPNVTKEFLLEWNFLFLQVTKQSQLTILTNKYYIYYLKYINTFNLQYNFSFDIRSIEKYIFRIMTKINQFLISNSSSTYFQYNVYQSINMQIFRNDDGTIDAELKGIQNTYISQKLNIPTFSFSDRPKLALYLDSYPFDKIYSFPQSCAKVQNLYFHSNKIPLKDIQQYMRKEPLIIAHYLLNQEQNHDSILDISQRENNAILINSNLANYNSDKNTQTLDLNNQNYIVLPLSLDLFNEKEFILSFYLRIKQNIQEWNNLTSGPIILSIANQQTNLLLYLSGDSLQQSQKLSLKIRDQDIQTNLLINSKQWNRITFSYFCSFHENKFQIILKIQNYPPFISQWIQNCLQGDKYEVSYLKNQQQTPNYQIIWNIRDILVFKGSLMRIQDTSDSNCDQLIGANLVICLLCSDGYYHGGAENQCQQYVPSISNSLLYNSELRQISQQFQCKGNSLNRQIIIPENVCLCSSQWLYLNKNDQQSSEDCERCSSSCDVCGSSFAQCNVYKKGYDLDGKCNNFDSGNGCIKLIRNFQFKTITKQIQFLNTCNGNDNMMKIDSTQISGAMAITIQFTFKIVDGSNENTSFPLLQIQDTTNQIINLQIKIFFRSSSKLVELQVYFNENYKFSLFVAKDYQLIYATIDLEEQKIEVSVLINERVRQISQKADIETIKGLRMNEVNLRFGGQQKGGSYCGEFLAGTFIYVNFSPINIIDKISLTNLYLDSFQIHFRSDVYRFISQFQFENSSDKQFKNIINNQPISYTSNIKTFGIFELLKGQLVQFSINPVNNERLLIMKFNFMISLLDKLTKINNYGWTIYQGGSNNIQYIQLQVHQSTVVRSNEYFLRFCSQNSCQSIKEIKIKNNQWYHLVFSLQVKQKINQQISISIKVCIDYTCLNYTIDDSDSTFAISKITDHSFIGSTNLNSILKINDIEVYSNTYLTIATEYGYYDDNCFVQVSPQTQTRNCLLCMPKYIQKNYKCIPLNEADLCQNSYDSSVFYFLYRQFNKCVLVPTTLPRNCAELDPNNLNQCLKCVSKTRDVNKFCDCLPSYFESNNSDCTPIQCEWFCKECIYKSNKCLSCWEESRDIIKNCSCKDGYYEDPITRLCKVCNSQCKTCQSSASNCLECISSDFMSLPACECYPGFYYNFESNSCQQCSTKCRTCIIKPDNCQKCSENRDIEENCDCKEGYVENIYGSCFANQHNCSDDCENCLPNNPKICIKCKNKDQIGSNCECSDKSLFKNSMQCLKCNLNEYFDLEQKLCLVCHQSCLTCKGPQNDQCSSCQWNYTLSSSNKCICEDQQNYNIDDNGNCIEGIDIISVNLSKDLTIQIIFSEDLNYDDSASINSSIFIYLQSVDRQNFRQKITGFDKNTITMQLEVLQSVSSEYIHVQIVDNTQLKNRYLTKTLKLKYKQQKYQFKVGPLIIVMKEEDKKDIKKINSLSDFISENQNPTISFIINFMKRFFIVLYVLNTIQPIGLFLLINTQYPPKLYSFIRVFGSFLYKEVPEEQNQLLFQTTPIQEQEPYTFWYVLFDIDEYEILNPNHKIMQNLGFIRNFLFMAQDALLQFILFFILLSILSILVIHRQKKKKRLLAKLEDIYTLITYQQIKYEETLISKTLIFRNWIIGQTFGLLDQSYLILVAGIYLQMQCTLQEYNKSFFTRLGVYLSIVFVIFMTYYGIRLFIALKSRNFKYIKEKDDKDPETITEIFLEYDFYSRSYHFVGYFKKTIICFVVIQLMSYPNAVMIAIPLIKLIFFIAQIVFKSFKNQKIKILKIIGDSLLIVTWCLISYNHFLYKYLQSHESIPQNLLDIYQNIGFACCVLIFVYNIIYFMIFVIQNIPILKFFWCFKSKKSFKLIIQRHRQQSGYAYKSQNAKNKNSNKNYRSYPIRFKKGEIVSINQSNLISLPSPKQECSSYKQKSKQKKNNISLLSYKTQSQLYSFNSIQI